MAGPFSSGPDAHEGVVHTMMDMLDYVHVVGIHELHPRHHQPVAAALKNIVHVGFAAAACGDAVIWCRGSVHRWFLEG